MIVAVSSRSMGLAAGRNFWTGLHREALVCARPALEIDPNFHLIWFTMSWMLESIDIAMSTT